MMRLEDLAQLVMQAPDPPPLDQMRARVQKRRRRRLRVTVIAVAVAISSGVAGFLVARQPGSTTATSSTPSPTFVTSLYGMRIEVDAPGVALGVPRFDATVQSDAGPFPGPPVVGVERTPLAAHATTASRYTSADGHGLYAIHSDAGGDELIGTWNGWSVNVTVDGLSDGERARLASLLRFDERDGFLVLDPVAPLRLVPSIGTEIVFDGVRIDGSSYPSGCPSLTASNERTSSGFTVRRDGSLAIWCDSRARVRVEVLPPAPVDALIESLHVKRIS